MATPNLGSPEEQAAYQAEQERLAAEKAAKQASADKYEAEHGDDYPIADATGGFAVGVGDALDDMFSAEEVSGPKGGAWGASGTAAAGYNAGQTAEGAAARDSYTGQGAAARDNYGGQGQQANDQMGGISANLSGQAAYAGQRDAPVTSKAGSDFHGAQASSARSTSQGLLNDASASTAQDRQLAALNEFAANTGSGPSAAEAQLAQQSDAAQRQALGMARSGRGAGDAAYALTDAINSNAATQQATGAQAAQLRAQEEATRKEQQLQALNAAMGGASQIRGQDLDTFNASLGVRSQDLQAQGLAQGQAQFDTTTQLAQTGLNDDARNDLNQQALGWAGLGAQTNLGLATLGEQTNLGLSSLGEETNLGHQQMGLDALNKQSDYELAQQKMELDAQIANQQADLEKDSGVTGMIGSALGAVAMSDEDAKKDIKSKKDVASFIGSAFGNGRSGSFARGLSSGMSASADSDMRDIEEAEKKKAALDRSMGKKALKTAKGAPAYSYTYKDPSQPGAKPGRMVGPMAQDLEKGPLGDSVVTDTPQGKMVDTNRLSMVNTSAIAEQQKQLDALNRALGKKAA